MGVRGKSIIKTIPFNRSTNSSTQFLESKILKYFKACEKDLTKTNKEALAYKCLELFDKWYDNAGYINGHDGIYVPHGTDPDYRIAVNAASKKGAHWLDGIPSFKVGKKEISTSEIKKMLK